MAEGGAPYGWGQATIQPGPVTTAAAMIPRANPPLELCALKAFFMQTARGSRWCPFGQAVLDNFSGAAWHHVNEPKETNVSSRSGRDWSEGKRPSQDTVLTSICVVVRRCEALYQSTAQIGPSVKGTLKNAKRKRKDIPLFCQNAYIFSVFVFSPSMCYHGCYFCFLKGGGALKLACVN